MSLCLYKTVPGMPLCLCACSRDHTAQLPEVNASNVHHPPVAVGGWWGTKPGFALGTSGFASGYAVTSRRGIFRSEQSAQNEKWWSRRGRHCGPAAEYGRSRGGFPTPTHHRLAAPSAPVRHPPPRVRRPADAGRRGGGAAYGHPLAGRRPIPGRGVKCGGKASPRGSNWRSKWWSRRGRPRRREGLAAVAEEVVARAGGRLTAAPSSRRDAARAAREQPEE